MCSKVKIPRGSDCCSVASLRCWSSLVFLHLHTLEESHFWVFIRISLQQIITNDFNFEGWALWRITWRSLWRGTEPIMAGGRRSLKRANNLWHRRSFVHWTRVAWWWLQLFWSLQLVSLALGKSAYKIPISSRTETLEGFRSRSIQSNSVFSKMVLVTGSAEALSGPSFLIYAISIFIAACCCCKFPVLRRKAVESPKTHFTFPLKGTLPPWASGLHPSKSRPTSIILSVAAPMIPSIRLNSSGFSERSFRFFVRREMAYWMSWSTLWTRSRQVLTSVRVFLMSNITRANVTTDATVDPMADKTARTTSGMPEKLNANQKPRFWGSRTNGKFWTGLRTRWESLVAQ